MSFYEDEDSGTTCSSVVGRGSYGVVKKTLLDGQLVAVKQIHKQYFNPLEASIMTTYNCALLNRALHIEFDDKGIYLIYQELAVSDLKEKIRAGHIPESTKKTWMIDICEALLFLRKENIIHCDIKPSNVLVYEDNTVKLSDFGCSTLIGIEKTGTRSDVCGTLSYTAPEVLTGGDVSHMADIWSLGCLFYELMTGSKLIRITSEDNRSKLLALRSIQHWRRQNGDEVTTCTSRSSTSCLPITFLLSGSGADLIHRMLRYDPHTRATLTSIMSHMWFRPENIPQRTIHFYVNCMMVGDVSAQEKSIRDYLSTRGIQPPAGFTQKAARIYATMSSRDVEHMECAVHVTQKLYRYRIEHYHPLTVLSRLSAVEIDFYQSVGFTVHKQSFYDMYADFEGE